MRRIILGEDIEARRNGLTIREKDSLQLQYVCYVKRDINST